MATPRKRDTPQQILPTFTLEVDNRPGLSSSLSLSLSLLHPSRVSNMLLKARHLPQKLELPLVSEMSFVPRDHLCKQTRRAHVATSAMVLSTLGSRRTTKLLSRQSQANKLRISVRIVHGPCEPRMLFDINTKGRRLAPIDIQKRADRVLR